MKYFTKDEFQQDGMTVYGKMDSVFLEQLDLLRENYGKPIFIRSSWRSPAKNQEVGGAPNSYHLSGRAVDIACSNGYDRLSLVREAIKLGLSVGVSNRFIHVDNRKTQLVYGYD